jgi:rubrerythrin
MNEKNLAELIDIAMEREESAYAFYMDTYEKVEDESVKDALKFLAEEEKGHKEFLINYKNGHYGQDALRLSDVVDYRIAEHLEEPTVKKDIELKDVYLAAAHRELIWPLLKSTTRVV